MNFFNDFLFKFKKEAAICLGELWKFSMTNKENWNIVTEIKVIELLKSQKTVDKKYKKIGYLWLFNVFFLNYKFFIYDFIKKSMMLGFFDYILSSFLIKCIKNNNFNNGIINNKISQSKNNFFIKLNLYNNKSSINSLITSFFYGFKSIYIFFKLWLIPLFLSLTILYFFISLRLLPVSKYMFLVISTGSFLYLLISGFVFFIKKYQYNKFTSAIQRFWRRTFILFWLIEGYTFLVFFYLSLNASAEPHYMYDTIQIYKSHLFSWRFFIQKTLPLVFLIIYTNITLLSLKWSIHSKISLNILIITILLIYVLWLEFYQFYYVINFYQNQIFFFDFDSYIWNLDIELKKTRTVNHYLMILMALKFWHLVFVFSFWIFFVLRVNEIGRSRYPLLSANLQNFILIYIMSWIYMFPWLKFIFRKYYNHYYYWFFVTPRQLRTKIFFTDLKLFYYSLRYDFLSNQFNLFYFKNSIFFYWNKTTLSLNSTLSRKQFIKDFIISDLLKN